MCKEAPESIDYVFLHSPISVSRSKGALGDSAFFSIISDWEIFGEVKKG